MNVTHIRGTERERLTAEMVRIPDLKPGDCVRWKDGFRSSVVPGYDDICEVCEVFSPRVQHHASGSPMDEHDFSILFLDDDGDYTEFCFDSRRFERVAHSEDNPESE